MPFILKILELILLQSLPLKRCHIINGNGITVELSHMHHYSLKKGFYSFSLDSIIHNWNMFQNHSGLYVSNKL